MPILCEAGTIQPYVPSAENPWDKQKVLHLYRRIGFGASFDQVESALTQNPGDLIDSLVDDAVNMPLTPAPEWAYWTWFDYTDPNTQIGDHREFLYKQFMLDMLNNGLRDKLTLFWSNHFVTQIEVYDSPPYMFQYYTLLQQQALGNLKDFVSAVGLTPAMLVFLNGYQNTAAEPNENYGRELYELFTLGENNGYTQTDIVETAKALSGYTLNTIPWGPIEFNDAEHDHSDKTIFGQTGDWGYDDVINILFDQRSNEIAEYLCTKLYRFFVSNNPDQDVIQAMKTTYLNNNFEIVPVLKQLFKSNHFFNENIIGVQVKSPMETALSYVNQTGFTLNDEVLLGIAYLGGLLGQVLFNPVDVAGWQGDRDWINSSTLTGRWLTIEYYVYGIFENFPTELTTLAYAIVGESTDPAYVTKQIVDYFIPNGLQTVDAYIQATDVFKWEVPQNYYDNNLWSLSWDTVPTQVALLLMHIGRIPAYQLT